MCKKFKVGHSEGPNEKFKNRRGLCHKQTVICCFGVFVFSVVLCLLNYFYLYRNDWSDEGQVTLLNLALGAQAWGAVCVYLHAQWFNSIKSKYPFLLRVWWGFYLCISCYCLVIDVILYIKCVNLPVQYSVSDVISVVSGFFLCYVRVFGKSEDEDTLLEEPLLNDDSGASNEPESSKSKGVETVTPYSIAGFFSSLTLSWLGSLISLGNKNTLDLEDVPQLTPGDSVVGAFPAFRNKLEAECGTVNKVITLKLVKALIFFAWKEILLTAIYVMMNTLASYVGPYLIDNFVQYLNGGKHYKSEGYVLVSVIFAAKFVERISKRHWSFRLQQVGIRVRSVLVTMIYNKGMTLSCKSKQGHTGGEIINLMIVDAERIGDFGRYMHDPWMVPLHVAITLSILYKNLGLASIAAFFFATGKISREVSGQDNGVKRQKDEGNL